MHRTLLKSKIHRVRVTATDKAYEGSITVDTELLAAADIVPHERVQVVNVTTGERFETYAIAGNDGEVCLNGAAARLAEPGDIVIIMSYARYAEDERHEPSIVFVDEMNTITEQTNGD
jgi:aspartate 1-decarboxylase